MTEQSLPPKHTNILKGKYFVEKGVIVTKLFGTDGIRGVANKEITPLLAFNVGRALGKYISLTNMGKVIIGRDTRTSGQMLECAFVSGLSSQGIDSDIVGLTSTPCISYLTRQKKYSAGVMITASHNLPEYNGIKIFDNNGIKFDEAQEKIIENILFNIDEYYYNDYLNIGKIKYCPRLINAYINYLKSLLKGTIQNICIDCANGGTTKIIQKLFSGNQQLFLINQEIDGKNINVNCGATNLDKLKQIVTTNNSSLGVAFDGDGDRIMLVSKEQIFDGDDIIYAFAVYNKLENVVGTTMSNFGLEKSLDNKGINLIRVDVGDKYVIDEMIKNNFILGGEQAGHIIQGNLSPTGDGVLTLISIINMGVSNFIKLCKQNKKYPQVLINVKVVDKNIIKSEKFKYYLGICESLLMENGRIVVRPSGTEPVIRIMVEGENKILINKIAKDIQNFILKM